MWGRLVSSRPTLCNCGGFRICKNTHKKGGSWGCCGHSKGFFSPGKTHQSVGMRSILSWLEVCLSSQEQPGTSTGAILGYQAHELINTEARSLHAEKGQPFHSCYKGRKQKQRHLLTAPLLLFGCFSKGPTDREVTRATRNRAALPNTSPLAAETQAGTHGEAASGCPAVPPALRNRVALTVSKNRGRGGYRSSG